MTEQKTISLSRGELTLRYQTTADYQLDDLLGFAERINPKRAFLFVSKVLGRHIPVSPDKMRQAFTQLATLIPDDLPEPIVVIGMAETAVGLSAGVHQVL
jgi:membrane protease subunit (stomatin/prohibitin family)